MLIDSYNLKPRVKLGADNDVLLQLEALSRRSVLLKTEKDLSYRKGPKRTFGHRKGLLFAIFIL